MNEIQDVKLAKDMLDLAKHIVKRKSVAFEPEKIEHHYETALIDLINHKHAGKPIRPRERQRGENVVELMKTLGRRFGGSRAAAKAEEGDADADRRLKAGQSRKGRTSPLAGRGCRAGQV